MGYTKNTTNIMPKKKPQNYFRGFFIKYFDFVNPKS